MKAYSSEKPYRLQLDSDIASLTVDAQVNPDESFTFTSTLAGSTNRPPSWHYYALNRPTNEVDFEAYVLSNPDGFSKFYQHPGRFEPIFRAMGICYSEQITVQADQSKLQSSFQITPLDHVDQKANELLGPNGQQFTHRDIGLYTPVEYATALREKQRIISNDSVSAVWLAHDRITHEPGERALGPTFIDYRQRIAEELVSKRSPEALNSFMFLDDKLTDSVTAAILTSDEATLEVPAPRGRSIPVEAVFRRYFRETARYSLKAYELSKADGAESVAREVTAELRDRLVTAATRLEAINA